MPGSTWPVRPSLAAAFPAHCPGGTNAAAALSTRDDPLGPFIASLPAPR